MYTSLGFHTFDIFLKLTYDEAIDLYKAFKNYPDVRVRPVERDKNNSTAYPKAYHVEYIRKHKGITWYIRFRETYSARMEKYENEYIELRKFSVRARVNPKILIGIQDYLTAASSSCLGDVEKQFNAEVARISPILCKFENYSINRADFCINLDLVELRIPCSTEQMMTLIKRGDVPAHFTEWTEYNNKTHRQEASKDALYLKNNSLTINCYPKQIQLMKVFPSCSDIENSKNLIRFEVQCKYNKVYSLAKERREDSTYNMKLAEDISIDEIMEEFIYHRNNVFPSNPIDVIISDAVANIVIRNYFLKVVGFGDYYSLDVARKIVNEKTSSKKVRDRLITALSYVNSCRGIASAKSKIEGTHLEEFKRSLKQLRNMGINPVTIPREWGISHIKNLFDAYLERVDYERMQEELVVAFLRKV